jgi:hypothetical protein
LKLVDKIFKFFSGSAIYIVFNNFIFFAINFNTAYINVPLFCSFPLVFLAMLLLY